MPGVDTRMTQHRFFLSLVSSIVSPALSQRKFQASPVGRAGNGEIPFSEEHLSSPMNTCGGTGMTACGPTVHNGCPAFISVFA